MADWLAEVLIVVLLIIAGGLLSAAGSALVSVRRSRVRQMADQGSRSAQRVLRLLEDPTRYTFSVQAAVVVLWLCASAVAVLGLTWGIRWELSGSSIAVVRQHSLAVSLALVLFCLSVGILVFGDVVPRSYAAHYGDRFALAAARPLEWVAWLLTAFVKIISWASALLLRPVGGKVRLGSPVLTEEDLKNLVEAVEEEGVIEEDEREMIDSIFEFSDTVVRQVMVPRIDMHVIAVDKTVNDLLDEIMECGHSRIPVYEGSVDSVIGIVHVKDLLPALRSGSAQDKSISDFMRGVLFVPENKRITELLAELKDARLQMAIVRDEYGGTAGLVTVEDLVEEIVGEIEDEYDQEEPLLMSLDGGISIVDARLNIDDLNEELATGLPEDEYDTIGGFVFGLMGKEPLEGDSVDYNGWCFTVEAKEGRRLRKIRISPRPVDEEAPAAEPSNGA